MHKILLNIANIELLIYCKKQKIDCSGTYVKKCFPRRYLYALLKQDGKDTPIASIEFHPDKVPTFLAYTTQ